MKLSIRLILVFLSGILSLTPLLAKPVPDALFGDHAVLQADAAVPVRGQATPGESLTLRYAQAEVRGQADAQGRWELTIPPLPSGTQGDLLIIGADGRAVSHDVIVGDVWLLSGQSNIEWTLKKSDNALADIAAADFPQIRHFKVPVKSSADPVDVAAGQWEVCTPQAAGAFSAIGYYLARDLWQATGRPQGLVNATKGGTRIRMWVNDALSPRSPALEKIVADYDKADADYPGAYAQWQHDLAAWDSAKADAEKQGKPFKAKKPQAPLGGPEAKGKPGSLYNAMVQPVLGIPYRAVIWYQGEANVGNAKDYGVLLRDLITGWRQAALQPDLPFVIYQLPNFGKMETTGLPWPLIREGQAEAAAALPDTYLVVSIDVSKDLPNIHPRNKADFAERLSRVILRDFYGKSVAASGPRIVGVEPVGDAMRVTLDTMDGVVLRENPQAGVAFELSGEDHVFYPAQASLENGELLVRSEQVAHPVELRYAFRICPVSILYNKAGLPAEPYRTDNFTH
jgi:sialate O-acetylesterase